MKPLVGVWRDSLRDSELASMPKLVGLTLTTYMNGRGYARPGRKTLARGCSVSVRTVETCARQLEAAGFLVIDWSDGGRGHTNAYQAVLPRTANEVRRSEWETANVTTQTANVTHQTANDVRPKAYESAESGSSGRLQGAARPFDDCMGRCGERRPLFEFNGRLVCKQCVLDETGDLGEQLHEHIAQLRAAT